MSLSGTDTAMRPKKSPASGGASCNQQDHFFIVLPGSVASPFLSTAAPGPAPCVLASLPDGCELVAAGPVPLFFIAEPVPCVVPPFIDSPVVVLLPAGPPACELPPAELPVCA